jgi:hypothetical protein
VAAVVAPLAFTCRYDLRECWKDWPAIQLELLNRELIGVLPKCCNPVADLLPRRLSELRFKSLIFNIEGFRDYGLSDCICKYISLQRFNHILLIFDF